MPCQKRQQKMVEGVQPFLIDQAVPFKSQYLAGFQAEKRDIEYEAIKNTSNKITRLFGIIVTGLCFWLYYVDKCSHGYFSKPRK